jgi:hypothetical protein
MEIEVTFKQSFSRIIRSLTKDQNLTTIAKAMGYTSTAQLHHALSENSLPSTKAVLLLIQNFNVNPIYLFTGQDEMFITEENDPEKLRKEVREWEKKHNEAVKTVLQLNEEIKKLEKQNKDLIEITTAAIKYHQGNKGTE